MLAGHRWIRIDGAQTLQVYQHECNGFDPAAGTIGLTGRGEWVSVLRIHANDHVEPLPGIEQHPTSDPPPR